MPKPAFLFAHGAGASSRSDWMRSWSRRLRTLGSVVTFDYPYMAAGRKAPDPLDRLVASHRAALARARKRHPGPVVLIGKSMGSRVGCHVSLEEDVDAIVCLGYPLVSPSNPRNVRDEVLRALTTPILFVQGTRDPLCPLAKLARVRRRMKAPNALHAVDGGDHSLLVGARELRARGTDQESIDDATLDAIAAFLDGVIGRARVAKPRTGRSKAGMPRRVR